MSGVSAGAIAMGIENIRLAYHYCDVGDLEGYASLLEADVEVDADGLLRGRGRDQVVDRVAALEAGAVQHHPNYVIPCDNRVIVLGSVSTKDSPATHDIVDVFTLSGHALIVRQRRYVLTHNSGIDREELER
ncbi:nuclear transport factor 2 family protein [Kribbella yunnanensis]|uniref:Nuclear transport factor 2 family protein n=1 Tax=Kribbella yunnanensis TaxID=190194 RepID=A0ABP4V144_9ACTN